MSEDCGLIAGLRHQHARSRRIRIIHSLADPVGEPEVRSRDGGDLGASAVRIKAATGQRTTVRRRGCQLEPPFVRDFGLSNINGHLTLARPSKNARTVLTELDLRSGSIEAVGIDHQALVLATRSTASADSIRLKFVARCDIETGFASRDRIVVRSIKVLP